MLYSVGVGPGIVDSYVVGVFCKCMIDVYDFGITDIRAVLLERHTKNKYPGILDFHPYEVHGFNVQIGNVGHIPSLRRRAENIIRGSTP